MEWHKIEFFKNQIKKETGKATLISCPRNSYYSCYCFWMPTALIREGKQGNTLTFSYTDDFEFILKKYGKGKHNKYDVIDTEVLRGEEIEDVYSGIPCGKKETQYNPFETHIPETIEAVDNKALPELTD